ncbi:sorting nexin 18 [Sciurus carolinensis]|uniref:Sorting nexin 18 n=1 Tax=Sciurus carolinensis TaxID=30640 RepID=A0AA41T4Z0_SCICA|nr:sorting nexin 18 [Sciurus carolinensis]
MGTSCRGVRATLLRSLALYHLRSENSGRSRCWSRRCRACVASRISRAGSRASTIAATASSRSLMNTVNQVPKLGPAGGGCPGAPACYANVQPGGFQSLLSAQHRPPPRLLQVPEQSLPAAVAAAAGTAAKYFPAALLGLSVRNFLSSLCHTFRRSRTLTAWKRTSSPMQKRPDLVDETYVRPSSADTM